VALGPGGTRRGGRAHFISIVGGWYTGKIAADVTNGRRRSLAKMMRTICRSGGRSGATGGWVRDAAVGLREHGGTLTGEGLVMPHDTTAVLVPPLKVAWRSWWTSSGLAHQSRVSANPSWPRSCVSQDMAEEPV